MLQLETGFGDPRGLVEHGLHASNAYFNQPSIAATQLSEQTA
jgi:hypothetical protein